MYIKWTILIIVSTWLLSSCLPKEMTKLLLKCETLDPVFLFANCNPPWCKSKSCGFEFWCAIKILNPCSFSLSLLLWSVLLGSHCQNSKYYLNKSWQILLCVCMVIILYFLYFEYRKKFDKLVIINIRKTLN